MIKKFFKIVFILIALVVVFTIGFVLWKTYQINAAPEEISYQVLSQEPTGVETYINCPDGTKLRTVSAGEGQTIVLAHGFGGTLRDWNLVFNQLVKEGHRVIAFEQRGHNKSSVGKDGISSMAMSSDYKTVLEHYDVKSAVLVGHSMGGFLTVKFLLDYANIAKERVHSALIMSSFAGDISRDNEQNKMQIPMIEKGYLQSILKVPSLATLFGASLIGKPNKAIVQSSLDNTKCQNYNQLIPILKAFVDENYYNRLGEITIPCTILVGSEDKTAPAFLSENLAKGIPHAQLLKIEGRGHLLNWEAPNEVCGFIKGLLPKVSGGVL
jgi:non-heme chloroperoxidase